MLDDAAGIRRVVLACGYVDLRKGIDGLSMIIGDRYHQNPFEKGTLFLFWYNENSLRSRTMADRHTLEEPNNCNREELITIVLMMQGQLDTLNENIERLIEQVRIANSYRFGKHTETLDSIDGQLSFFDEAESCCDLSVPEPATEEVLPSRRNHKKKGQREMDLKNFPEEILSPYHVSTEELDVP